MRIANCLIVVFLLAFSPTAQSQDTAIDVGTFEDYIEVQPLLRTWQPVPEVNDPAGIDTSLFIKSNGAPGRDDFFRQRWYLFSLVYNGDESVTTVYFYPGKMVSTRIFRLDSARGWIPVESRKAFRALSLSSQITVAPLRLPKGRVMHFLVQPELHYYNWNQWSPSIAQETAIDDLMLQEFIQPNFTYSILSILMAGMMFMLFSYSFLKFYLNKRSEYLYNSLFALAFLLFFAVVFINNYYFQLWWHKYAAFFQYWFQVLGYIFEFIFIIRFLELRQRKPQLFLVLRISIISMMVYCCVLPFVAFSDRLYPFSRVVFEAISLMLIAVGLYAAVVLHYWNRHLSRYVSFGLFSLLGFTGLIILQNTLFIDKQHLVQKIGGPVILYHAGILANLFFFRLGLGQKERSEELQKLEDIEMLRLENEKKELEKVLAMASSRVDERNRIAKEIHDDIGSGLTSIRLLSEIALVKRDNKDELNKISSNANELVNNLNEIIWSINSKNDTLPNLLAYIRSHMVDYLEPYNLKLSINIPAEVPAVELSGEKRRNIFMVIKECFTNIIKHANASAVNFTVQIRDQLIFTIKDNGKGFNSKNILPFKNGIRNMRERIEHVGGEIEIWGNNGTTITIKIPLNGNNTHL